jgi:hypothetical protein
MTVSYVMSVVSRYVIHVGLVVLRVVLTLVALTWMPAAHR